MLEFGRQGFFDCFLHIDSALKLGNLFPHFFRTFSALLFKIFNFFIENFCKCYPFFLSLICSLTSEFLFLTYKILFISSLDFKIILEGFESQMSLFMV